MRDEKKTKRELVEELKVLRHRVSELEGSVESVEEDQAGVVRIGKLLEQVVGHAPIWFWAGNVDSSEIYLTSPGSRLLTGYEPEDFVARPSLWFELIHEEDRRKAAEANERARAEKAPVSFECRIGHKDGTFRWMYDMVIPECDERGELVGVFGFAVDITERKKAEEALRALKDFNYDVIQSIPSGLVAHDLNMRVTLWNKAMEEVSGYKAEEVLGKNPYEMFPHLEGEGLEELHKTALEGTIVTRASIPYRTPKGKSGFTNETYFPLRDSDGEVVGVMGIIEDVTEIVRLEKEVGRLHEEIEQRKLVEVAKGILMREVGLSEAESYGLIQKRSRDEGTKMLDVARLVISLHGSPEERVKFI